MNTKQLIAAHLAAGAGLALANALAQDGILPQGHQLTHGQIALANETRFNQAFFSQPLTTYAVGWRDPGQLDAALEFFAPRVPVPRRFEYAEFINAEEFYSDSADDDLRAPRGDFKRVEYTSRKTNAKTDNRGLTIRVDLDEVGEMPGWEEMYTSKLIRRLKRNALRRAVTLLSAAATNTAKTWDATAGKDPDQDVLSDLITAADTSGVRPNRIGYGDTAWNKRGLSHRAQDSAGGFASAAMNEGQVSGLLSVDQVFVSRERYASSASAKTQIVNNLVLMFMAAAGQTPEDASNIKRFVTPAGSGDVRVFTEQVGAKCYDITVEHYDLVKVTSTLGIRKFTVS